MNENEIKRIDRITKTVNALLNGHNPEPIEVDDAGDDKIRQLIPMD